MISGNVSLLFGYPRLLLGSRSVTSFNVQAHNQHFFWPKSVVRTVIWGHYLIYILKEINSEYSLNGLRLKLKLQYFGHLMQRAYSLERTLMLGRIEGKRRRGVTEDEMVR